MKDDIYFSHRETEYEDFDSGRHDETAEEYEDIYSSTHTRKPRPSDSNGRPPQSGKRPAPKKKKRKRGCGCFTGIIAVFLTICIVIGLAGYHTITGLFDAVTFDTDLHSNVFVDENDLYKHKDVTNILFIGVDRRNSDEASRSDTMMLFTIDRVNKKIKLTSFMRDMWVGIPDNGYGKINSSCVWGGPQLVMDTIEYNFNVDIDNYILVDFEMFTKIVDGLGGVTVEVTEKEAKYFGSGSMYAPPMKIQPGNTLLNGEEALWYCRIRYLDDDFKRTERQRKTLNAIIDKARQTSLPELIKIAKDIMPYIETGIPQKELASLAAGAAVSFLKYDVEQHSVPAKDTWSYGTKKGMSVIITDVEKNKLLLYDFIYTANKPEEASSEE